MTVGSLLIASIITIHVEGNPPAAFVPELQASLEARTGARVRIDPESTACESAVACFAEVSARAPADEVIRAVWITGLARDEIVFERLLPGEAADQFAVEVGPDGFGSSIAQAVAQLYPTARTPSLAVRPPPPESEVDLSPVSVGAVSVGVVALIAGAVLAIDGRRHSSRLQDDPFVVPSAHDEVASARERSVGAARVGLIGGSILLALGVGTALLD